MAIIDTLGDDTVCLDCFIHDMLHVILFKLSAMPALVCHGFQPVYSFHILIGLEGFVLTQLFIFRIQFVCFERNFQRIFFAHGRIDRHTCCNQFLGHDFDSFRIVAGSDLRLQLFCSFKSCRHIFLRNILRNMIQIKDELLEFFFD